MSTSTSTLKSLNFDPKPLIYSVFDIETNAPDNDRVWALGYRDARGYRKFSVETGEESTPIAPDEDGGCIDQFMRFILDGRGQTIYSHNGGNFDLQYVVRWIVAKAAAFEIRCEIIPLSSSIMSIDLHRGKNTWRFLDSGRILTNGSNALSLSAIATMFGLPDKAIPPNVDKESFYRELHRNSERWIYLKTDVDILYEAIAKFDALIRKAGGQVSMSGASTAMQTYRLAYMPCDIVISRHFPKCDRDEGNEDGQCVGCMHDMFREAYFGGNVQCFDVAPFVSDVDVHYGDVNSMYPYAMLNVMPTERFSIDKTRHKPKWEREIGFVEATVHIPDNTYLPPLPFRRKNKLIFPAGEFRGTWEATELALIERVGGKVLEVHNAVWAEGNFIFARYVKELYKYRDKTRADFEPGMAGVAKILMNALYGKFGSNYDREKIWIAPTTEEIKDKRLRDMCDHFRNLFVEDVFVYPDYIIPQIAARITALARVQLWSLMKEALDAGAKLYYCDTDSIISTHAFKWSTELGGMKLEKSARRGHFVAPKLYRFGDSATDEFRKAKGFGAGFGGKHTSEDFQRIIDGGLFVTSRLAKLKTWARAGNSPRVFKAPKQRQSEYDKRFVFPSGETRAWIMRNGELF